MITKILFLPILIAFCTLAVIDIDTKPPLIQNQQPQDKLIVNIEPVKQEPIIATKIEPSKYTGQKLLWLEQSGIPKTDWDYVDYIVSKESSWRPTAVNKSSGACGLAQQLPCGKWLGDWENPVLALKNQYIYVTQRYGSYANAVKFWKNNNWY